LIDYELVQVYIRHLAKIKNLTLGEE